MNRYMSIVVFVLLVLVLWQCNVPDNRACAATTNEVAGDEFDDEFDVVEQPRVRDPFGWYNRFMFTVNDKVYFWVLKPVGKAYGKVVPQKVRTAVQRCARNLEFPSRFVNNGLQGKLKGAGVELARFGINSTIGVAGLFDPAESMFDLKPSEEDFGQTLGRYGVGGGCPLVLPLLGTSNLRDTIGLIPGYFLHPITYVDPLEVAVGARCYEKANYVSLHIGEYEILKKSAMDPYTLMRDAYRQKREVDIEE